MAPCRLVSEPVIQAHKSAFTTKMKPLVLAEHDGATLRGASLSALAFAQDVAAAGGDQPSWLIVGHNVGSVAAEAARYAPVLVVDAPELATPLAEPFARIIAAVIKQRGFDLLAAASSTFSKDIVPRAAGLLGGAMATDVLRHEIVDGRLHYDTPRYAGAVVATIRLNGSPQLALVRASSYEAATPRADVQTIEHLEFDAATLARRGTSEPGEAKKNARPDVTEARVVVSGGRALKNAEDFERLVGGLADVLGGATGSSRALVDAGITPNDLQVGQTGKIIAPELYIAVGISGAVQHLAGMKNSRTIVAINSDAEAPIFDVADYALVGDVYEVVPQLIEKLAKYPERSF
jgi:electron transfer flavoprotein alpha subunit